MLTIEEIRKKIYPLCLEYKIKSAYLFGSYAHGEDDDEIDLDFLVFGGKNFKPTDSFSMYEDLREIFNKKIDLFEISEINSDSEFYKKIMQEKVLVV